MPTFSEIPLVAQNQRFSITLNQKTYFMRLIYRETRTNDITAGWTLDIYDSNNNPVLVGLPLVTGVDLLAQYQYLNIGGGSCGLFLYTTGDPDAVPTFTMLGNQSQLYFVQLP